MLRIDHGHNRVERVVSGYILVDKEGLRDRRWIGQAGGLDDHSVEGIRPCLAALAQLAEDAYEVTSHRAADATIVHLDDLLAAALEEQIIVHPSLAEFVLYHGDALAVTLAKDAIEQRRLARAKEAGEDRHRDLACRAQGCGGRRKRIHFSTCVVPTDPMAKRLAMSCSRDVTPLSISSVSAAFSHCS